MTLSERMIMYRARHNLNQEEFAKLCNVTKQTICSIETGIQNPSKLTKAKIELVLSQEEKEEM